MVLPPPDAAAAAAFAAAAFASTASCDWDDDDGHCRCEFGGLCPVRDCGEKTVGPRHSSSSSLHCTSFSCAQKSIPRARGGDHRSQTSHVIGREGIECRKGDCWVVCGFTEARDGACEDRKPNEARKSLLVLVVDHAASCAPFSKGGAGKDSPLDVKRRHTICDCLGGRLLLGVCWCLSIHSIVIIRLRARCVMICMFFASLWFQYDPIDQRQEKASQESGRQDEASLFSP